MARVVLGREWAEEGGGGGGEGGGGGVERVTAVGITAVGRSDI